MYLRCVDKSIIVPQKHGSHFVCPTHIPNYPNVYTHARIHTTDAHRHTSGQGLFQDEFSTVCSLITEPIELDGVHFCLGMWNLFVFLSPLIVSGLLLPVASLPALTVLIQLQWNTRDLLEMTSFRLVK